MYSRKTPLRKRKGLKEERRIELKKRRGEENEKKMGTTEIDEGREELCRCFIGLVGDV